MVWSGLKQRAQFREAVPSVWMSRIAQLFSPLNGPQAHPLCVPTARSLEKGPVTLRALCAVFMSSS